jgi:hypothetical protein
MADSAGAHSYGAALYYGSYIATNPTTAPPGGFGAFTEIGEVISMNGAPMTRPATKLTHLKSDNRAHEKIPGLLDGGQLTVQLNLTKARMAQLHATLFNETVNSGNDHNRFKFVVHVEGMGALCVKGFLGQFPVTIPEDDRVTIDLTIEISGKPAWVSYP